jgi:hypothetical protein
MNASPEYPAFAPDPECPDEIDPTVWGDASDADRQDVYGRSAPPATAAVRRWTVAESLAQLADRCRDVQRRCLASADRHQTRADAAAHSVLVLPHRRTAARRRDQALTAGALADIATTLDWLTPPDERPAMEAAVARLAARLEQP